MSTEREFDGLLRSWFDDSARAAQPEHLLESVLRETARTRPRPAWLVRADGRSGLHRFAPVLLAAALVVLAAIGLNVLIRPPHNVGIPTPVPVPSRAAATPEPTAQPTPEPVSFGALESYQAKLASDTVGWVWTGSALYRTSDAGQTWTPIALPRPSVSAVSLVDADTAYVAFFEKRTWTIAATHDGGTSWSEVGVDPLVATADVSFAMQSGSVGSVTFSTGKVFETHDGGATWSGPFSGAADPNVGQFLFKKLPGDRGVISYSNGKYDNIPFDDLFWFSTDGGRTWKQRSFPTDDVSRAGVLKALSGTPWIDDSQMLIAVNVEDVGLTAFYKSVDDAQSWQYIDQIPNWQGTMTFLSPTEWVGCSGSCWSTQDGGATWRERLMPVWARLDEVTFASVDRGWGVVACRPGVGLTNIPAECDGTVKSVLMQTTDGGETWRRIG